MLATDLDGTLLQPDRSVSPRTHEALAAAREAGLVITLVTGRPARWLAPVADQVGWDGLAVSANGAVLLDLGSRRIEHITPISVDDLAATIDIIRSHVGGTGFAVEYAEVGGEIPQHPQSHDSGGGLPEHFARDHHYIPKLAPPTEVVVGNIEELVTVRPVVKLLARSPHVPLEQVDDVYEQLREQLTDLVTVTHSTPGELLLEIAERDTSKATGLAWLAQAHGVQQQDVVAVGDMPNDSPMLQWAGQGWAVGNAHPQVKKLVGSDYVLPPNTEDAVAVLIEQLLA